MIALVLDGDPEVRDREVHPPDEAALAISHHLLTREVGDPVPDEEHPQLGFLRRLRGAVDQRERRPEPCASTWATLDRGGDGRGGHPPATIRHEHIPDGDEFGEDRMSPRSQKVRIRLVAGIPSSVERSESGRSRCQPMTCFPRRARTPLGVVMQTDPSLACLGGSGSFQSSAAVAWL